MGNVEDRNVRSLDRLLEQLVNFVMGFIIKGAQRFVQAEVFRMNGEGSPQGNPLAFPSAQGIGHPVQQVRDAQAFG